MATALAIFSACFYDTGGSPVAAPGTAGGATTTASPDPTTTGTADASTGGSTTDASTGELSAGSSTGPAGTSTGTGPGCEETPWYIDGDGDGFGDDASVTQSCVEPPGHVEVGGDCDDGDAAVSPDALELCDAVDNDCDAAVDEYSAMNSACDGCAMTPWMDRVFYACASQVPWAAARARCQGFGADLAIVHSADENLALRDALVEMDAGNLWWFGLADEVVEGDFGWVDGTDVDFQAWKDGEPSNFENEDCGQLVVSFFGAVWNDAKCANAEPFVCEGAG